MRKIIILASLLLVAMQISHAQQQVTPVPSAAQLKWGDLEYYFFVHFGPNTFTDLEWGKGTEQEELFNPSELDCRQWCRLANGTELAITAAYHDLRGDERR